MPAENRRRSPRGSSGSVPGAEVGVPNASHQHSRSGSGGAATMMMQSGWLDPHSLAGVSDGSGTGTQPPAGVVAVARVSGSSFPRTRVLMGLFGAAGQQLQFLDYANECSDLNLALLRLKLRGAAVLG
jgi:hypothetical protein